MIRITVLAVALFTSAAFAQESPTAFRVIGWNLESGESEVRLLKSQMAAKQGVHLWGLSEVPQQGAITHLTAGAQDGEDGEFKSILGTTGGDDRLAIIYDAKRLEFKEKQQLAFIQIRDSLRAPLVAKFKGRQTGQEFLFVVNHLKRGGAQNETRIQQAKLLNQWARQQTVPIIAVGDYNFDFDVERGDAGVPNRDQGFDEMIRNNVFTWIRPERLLKTNADEDFNTVLDFVFVANPPHASWRAESRILNREGDEVATENEFPDSRSQSDHRPVDLILNLGASDGGEDPDDTPSERAQILRRIRELEAEIARLREALEEME